MLTPRDARLDQQAPACSRRPAAARRSTRTPTASCSARASAPSCSSASTEAVADGDHVHGVILAGGVNGDGRTNGLTAPSAASQAELLAAGARAGRRRPGRDRLRRGPRHRHAARRPDRGQGRCARRSATRRGADVALGSVKGNIGHTTMAAGIAGLLKVLLALRHGRCRRPLDFRAPTPRSTSAGPARPSTRLADVARRSVRPARRRRELLRVQRDQRAPRRRRAARAAPAEPAAERRYAVVPSAAEPGGAARSIARAGRPPQTAGAPAVGRRRLHARAWAAATLPRARGDRRRRPRRPGAPSADAPPPGTRRRRDAAARRRAAHTVAGRRGSPRRRWPGRLESACSTGPGRAGPPLDVPRRRPGHAGRGRTSPGRAGVTRRGPGLAGRRAPDRRDSRAAGRCRAPARVDAAGAPAGPVGVSGVQWLRPVTEARPPVTARSAAGRPTRLELDAAGAPASAAGCGPVRRPEETVDLAAILARCPNCATAPTSTPAFAAAGLGTGRRSGRCRRGAAAGPRRRPLGRPRRAGDPVLARTR